MEIKPCTECGLLGIHACIGSLSNVHQWNQVPIPSKNLNAIKVTFVTPTKTACYAHHANGEEYKVSGATKDGLVLYGHDCFAQYSDIDRLIVREERCNPSTLQSQRQGN